MHDHAACSLLQEQSNVLSNCVSAGELAGHAKEAALQFQSGQTTSGNAALVAPACLWRDCLDASAETLFVNARGLIAIRKPLNPCVDW